MRNQQGFSFIEMMLAIGILSMALLPIIMGMTKSLKGTTDSSIRQKAATVALDMMNDIKSKRWDENSNAPFSDPLGPDGESGPATYDDIDDWNGYTSTVQKEGANFAVSFTVDYAVITSLGGNKYRVEVISAVSPTDYKRVVVNVEGPSRQKISFTKIFFND